MTIRCPGLGLASSTDSADRRVVGDAVEEQQLLEAEVQRRAHVRASMRLPAGHLPEDPVVGAAALDGAEGEPLGERAVARVETRGVRVQRAVGVGAALERAHDDGMRGDTRGARA